MFNSPVTLVGGQNDGDVIDRPNLDNHQCFISDGELYSLRGPKAEHVRLGAIVWVSLPFHDSCSGIEARLCSVDGTKCEVRIEPEEFFELGGYTISDLPIQHLRYGME